VEKGIVVPRKAVQEILKIIEKEEEVALGLEGNRLVLKTQDTTLSIQLLQAGFPEYQLIIPDVRPCSFRVNRDDFHAALKRVAVLTNLKWRYVRFVISSGMLQLESENLELGSAADDLDIDYEGEEFNVAFNIRYVMEAIQSVDSGQVRFEWVDSFHGGVFLDDEDPGYLGLIMPMVV
jgi:DNA polymerase-3 subunit beta